MSDDLKVGDIIYARVITKFRGERRRPMTVINVDGDAFVAELINGDFGTPGVDRKMFHKRHQDWTRYP